MTNHNDVKITVNVLAIAIICVSILFLHRRETIGKINVNDLSTKIQAELPTQFHLWQEIIWVGFDSMGQRPKKATMQGSFPFCLVCRLSSTNANVLQPALADWPLYTKKPNLLGNWRTIVRQGWQMTHWEHKH